MKKETINKDCGGKVFKPSRKVSIVLLAILLLLGAVVAFYRECGFSYRLYTQVPQLNAFFKEHQIKNVYAARKYHWINNLLKGECVFTAFTAERQESNAERMEVADDVAILNPVGLAEEYGAPGAFLRYSGGAASVGECGDFRVYHDFRPPADLRREIPPEALLSVVDQRGRDLFKTLTDCSMLTLWRGDDGQEGRIEVELKNPALVSGIRLLSNREQYPVSLRIQGRMSGAEEWVDLVEEGPVSGLFWSGSRVYYGGAFGRLDCRFKPTRVKFVKITIPGTKVPYPNNISELQLFAPETGQYVSDKESLPVLLEFLKQNGIDSLYCDRWLANAVRTATKGAVSAPREPALTSMDKHSRGIQVPLVAAMAILVRQEDAGLERRTLAKSRVKMRETNLGPWVIFDFGQGLWRDWYSRIEGLSWNGAACLVGDAKRLAFCFARLGYENYRKDDQVRRRESEAMIEQALAEYSNIMTAYVILGQWYWEDGNMERAGVCRKHAEEMWKPELPTSVRFGNGVEFRGLQLSGRVVAPGQDIVVRYFWSSPPSLGVDNLVAFVHFVQGTEVVFKDDHRLLEDFSTGYQPTPEVFVEERRVAVPVNAAAGKYQVEIGLTDTARNNSRIAGKSDLRNHESSFVVPVDIEVRTGM